MNRPAHRTRLQVEALEDRCLLAWGAVPPATLPLDVLTGAETVALNTQGNASITANQQIDYYSFVVPVGAPPATYVISASTPLSSLDTVLGLYDATGLRIAFNDDVSSTNFDSRVRLFLPAGTYYFGITNLAGTPPGSYTWSVDGPADFYENNDTFETASDLGTLTEQTTFFGLGLNDGADWYRFTMNGVGTSTSQVAISFTHDDGDLQLELTNAAGEPLGLSATADDTETISLEGLPAGTYFVHVFGTSNPSYSLTIDPGTTPISPLTLDASGSATGTGTIKLEPESDEDGFQHPVPDVIKFTATVAGRVSILMRADQQFMQSLLSLPDPNLVLSEAFVASQFDGTRDHVIQFDVEANTVYTFSASVFMDPERGMVPPAVGAYRLFISTEPLGSDFSATTPTVVPLDASGSGLQLGTLETLDDVDLFRFTAVATGRTTVRVDGGADEDQVVHLLTTPGQTFTVEVKDPGRLGVYVLTITSIADDFPDNQIIPIVLDATGSANVKGSINYAGDEDVFRFTANQTGTMTVMMQGRPGVESFSALVGELSVTPVLPSYEFSPTRFSSADRPASDRIVQFQVVQGRRYTIRASGAEGTVGDYLLSFVMAVDDATATRTVDLAASPTGSIETPQDQDRFQFTADFDGFVIVAMEPMAGTNMQGLLTVPSMPAVVGTQSGPGWQFTHFGPPTDGILFQAVSESGWEEDSRHAFLGFVVQEGHTYEFQVSGNQTTIGAYKLSFSSYRAPEDSELYGFGDTFLTRSLTRIGNAVSTNVRFLQFIFDNLNPPLISVLDQGIAPVPETGKAPGPTNTRLAVFALPGTNGGNTPDPVTVPSGQATLAANSLINTLLTVAARDNAVQSTGSAAVAQGPAEVTPALLASLLVGVIAPGGADGTAAPPVGGTVFEDLDGNGRLDAGETGVAGETIVLEVLRDGQYVVVATAVTNGQGAYAFAEVPAGEYRVRRLAPAGAGSALTTPASHPVKVTGDGKPKTLDFGKPGQRGHIQLDRPAPAPGGTAAQFAWHEEPEIDPELGQAFQDWCDLDEPDDAPAGCWLALLPLAPAVALARPKRLLQARE